MLHLTAGKRSDFNREAAIVVETITSNVRQWSNSVNMINARTVLSRVYYDNFGNVTIECQTKTCRVLFSSQRFRL